MNHPLRQLRRRLRLGDKSWPSRHRTLTGIAAIVAIVVGIGTIFQLWIVRDPGQPTSAVEGKVRKAGRGPWHDVDGAWPGALLEYDVTARNPGGLMLNNLVVSVSIPAGIRALPETCRYAAGSHEGRCPPDWPTAGISQPALDVSDSVSIVFQALLRRGVGGAFQTLRVEMNSDETPPVVDRVELKPRATHAQAAARSLVRGVSPGGSIDWQGRPALALRSERLLAARWRQLNPERLHGLATVHPDQMASVTRIVHDHRLDGQVVAFSAVVAEDPITYVGYRPPHGSGGSRLAMQRFSVEAEDGSGRAWCIATRPRGRRLHAGDRILVRAVPLAWGDVIADGSLAPAVSLDCAAVHRIPGPAPEEEPSGGASVVAVRGPCE